MHVWIVILMGVVNISYFLRVALVILVLAVAESPMVAWTTEIGSKVNYISADAIYVNVGSAAGLSIGSRVQLIRNGSVIAVLEIEHISSHSASCRIISQSEDPRVGDAVFFDRPSTSVTEPETLRVKTTKPRDSEPQSKRHAIRGNLSFQNQWYRDLGESRLSSVQPGVSARLLVDDIFGVGGTVRIRHHTRLYHRSQPLSIEPNTDEWIHRLSEFGIYFPIFDDPDAIGIGRIVNPYMRGLGYLDGGYVALRVHPRFRLGFAGGMDPNLEDSSVQPDNQRYGVFLTHEAGTFSTQRLATTVAVSGSYKGGIIDREFGYVQNILSFGHRLSIYHSMEIEVNRGWRKDADGNSVSISNTYFTTNISFSRWLNVDMSYDARRNFRDYRVIDTPDSLFNDAFTSGYSGGVTLSMPANIRIRARGGERWRENDDYNNRFGSMSFHVRRFPMRGHSVLARLSVSETPLVTGYRSAFVYRFPLTRRTRVNLGGGNYLYKQALLETSSTYGEVGVHQMLGRRYYLSVNYRWLTGGILNSMQLLTDVGVSF